MSESATTSPFAEPPAAAATALGEDLVDFIINNNNDTNPVFHQLDNASIDYQPAEDCSDQQLLLEKQFLWSPSPPTTNTQQVEDLPLPTQARKKRKIERQPLQPRKLFQEDMTVEGVHPYASFQKWMRPEQVSMLSRCHSTVTSYIRSSQMTS